MVIINNMIFGCILSINRSPKNTPAVTRVDEWTNAEIGVGAAMAIGNQAEKGNWALFLNAAIINKSNVIIE